MIHRAGSGIFLHVESFDLNGWFYSLWKSVATLTQPPTGTTGHFIQVHLEDCSIWNDPGGAGAYVNQVVKDPVGRRKTRSTRPTIY